MLVLSPKTRRETGQPWLRRNPKASRNYRIMNYSSIYVSIGLRQIASKPFKWSGALAAGILMACATMFARILLVTSILNSALFQMLVPPLAVMAALTYLAAFLLWRKAGDFSPDQEIKLQNPFQIVTALKFGALLLAVMLLSQLLKLHFGDIGTYFLAAVSGITDVDAITLSMANMSKTTQELNVAGYAILIAVFANTLFKNILAWLVGNRALFLRVGGASVFAVVAGLVMI
jgi:uncharacterized membrane protein (DUF4010 family)